MIIFAVGFVWDFGETVFVVFIGLVYFASGFDLFRDLGFDYCIFVCVD